MDMILLSIYVSARICMWNPLQGMFDSRFNYLNKSHPTALRCWDPGEFATQVSIWQPWSSLEWWCKWNGILSLIHFPPSSHVCWLGGCIMLLVPIWWNAPVPTWDFLSLLLGFQKLNFSGDSSKNRLTCRNIICLTMVSHRTSIWTDAFWSNWLKQIWCTVFGAFPHRGIVICFCFKMLKTPKMRSEVESFIIFLMLAPCLQGSVASFSKQHKTSC